MNAEASQLQEAVRRHAAALEKSGDLPGALRVWELLTRTRHDAALTSVAKSRVARLSRRIRDRARAEELLANDERDIDAAIAQSEKDSDFGLVVEVRRLQLDGQRDVRHLTALGSALRRAGDLGEAAEILAEAIRIDPSTRSNSHTYVAKAALLRATGDKRGARDLLEQLHRAAPGDPYVATTLAAVYLDYVEENGEIRLLDSAEHLVGIAYAQQHHPLETRGLYGRLDALRRKAPV